MFCAAVADWRMSMEPGAPSKSMREERRKGEGRRDTGGQGWLNEGARSEDLSERG